MKLLRISYTNFKGQSRDIDIPDKGIELQGETGSGKTTVLDAISYCLYGKFSDRTVTSPKPLDEHNKPLTCDVETELVTDKGTFKRVYKEKWVKKRGSLDREFEGHETEYFIDDVPVRQKDFDEEVQKHFTEEQFYCSAIPTYFVTGLDWKKRRAILSSMFAEPLEEELLSREPRLEEIMVFGYKAEDYEKELKKEKATFKRLSDDRESIPARIDENRLTVKEVDMTAEQISKEKESLLKKRATILSTGTDPDLQNKIIELERQEHETAKTCYDKQKEVDTAADKKIADIRLEYESAIKANTEKDEKLREKCNDLVMKRDTLRHNISKKDRNIESYQRELAELIDDNVKARQQIEKAEKSLADPSVTHCSFCNQELPADKRKEAIAEINHKIEQYQKIIELREKDILGRERLQTAAKNDKADMEKLLEATLKAFEEKDKEQEQLVENYKEIRSKLSEKEQVIKEAALHDKTEIDKKYNEVALRLRAKREELQNKKIKPDTTEIDNALEDIAEKEAIIYRNNEAENRVKELIEKGKELAKQAEASMKRIYLLELRIRTWAGIIEHKLNEHFKYATFKLFHVQVNGELKEVCDVLYNGRDTMSSGEQIFVGVDISEGLSKHWNIETPLLVDALQNLTKPLETERQQILTRTVKGQAVLKVEEL